jgi:indolepyruvate ferredoxin oxidoreductase beta subunit
MNKQKSNNGTVNIILAGVGGQGLVLLTDMLCEAGHRAGYDVKSNDVVGLSQRGGKVWGSVRLGNKIYSPNVRRGEADYILALEPLEGLRWQGFLKTGGKLFASTSEIYPVFAIAEQSEYPHDLENHVRPDIEFVKHDIHTLSMKLGTVKVTNVMMMGLLARQLDIPGEIWVAVIRETVPEKFVNENLKAFELGKSL